VRLGNIAGQADTLVQLGNLYGDTGRLEEAVAFYRQTADKYIEIQDVASEGRARNNVAITLRKLGRFDESRQEVLRAIECNAQFGHAAEPWKSLAVPTDIEMDAGNVAAAAEANHRPTASYLTYRRDGGENQNIDGRICLVVTQLLLAGDPAAAASRLQEFA
jgi:tetratricopeptide (TPR) repeat protein